MTKMHRGRQVKFVVTETKETDKKRIDDAYNFLDLAFRDYLAARTLFLNCLLPQGAILASTSIEKYFKAVISLKGNTCPKHLGKELIHAFRNTWRELFAALNHEFIEFLERVYKLRYVDDLEKGFNLCISRRKTLAELDFTVAQIENRLVREYEGEVVERLYTKLLKGETYMAPLLWQDNYFLNPRVSISRTASESSVAEQTARQLGSDSDQRS